MSVYKRKDTAFNKRLANFRAESGLRPVKPFPKTAQKMVVVTVEESGDLTFLKTDSADVFLELGAVVTRRASHVEPTDFWLRIAFSLIRTLFPYTTLFRSVHAAMRPVSGKSVRIKLNAMRSQKSVGST